MTIPNQQEKLRVKCSTLDQDQRKRGLLLVKTVTSREDSPQSERHYIAEKMMLTFAESTQPVFRSTSPLSRGTLKRKGDGKLSLDFCADKRTIKTVFGTLISVNQLSLH